MSNIVPLNQMDAGQLANLQSLFAVDTSMVVSGGFPTLSQAGKNWHIKRGGNSTIVNVPGTDQPASSIQVSVIAYNPHTSHTYYAEAYESGSKSKPTCYSNDGVAPAPDAQTPQAVKCAGCAHNVFGSASTGKGKACAETRRLAVAMPDNLDDPMLLNVKTTSLKPLGDYQREVASRKMAIEALVTQVGFDPNESYPKLTFKAAGFITPEMGKKILELKESSLVKQIIGTEHVAFVDESADEIPFGEAPVAEAPAPEVAEEAKPAPKKAAKKKAAPKPEPVATADASDDDMFAALDSVMGQ